MTQEVNENPVLIPVPGGRTADVLVSGNLADRALVLHLGTPSGVVASAAMDQAAAARGLCTVRYARPGYSRSAPQPGRTVADAAADVAAILDELGVGEFVTAGWSGGGPHALACAALLPGRCLAATTIAGVAPYGSPGLDWLAGMAQDNIEEFSATLAGRDTLTDYLAGPAAVLAGFTGPDLSAGMNDLISATDEAALDEEFAGYLAACFRAAVQQGAVGWRDDDLALLGDWGFSLDAAGQVPVAVWQGDQDRMVPAAHGEWLAARIPGAGARMRPGEGHLTLITACYGEILDDLLDSAGLTRR
jgi:pimeloyl-ACP methyl ester carboxylesterase